MVICVGPICLPLWPIVAIAVKPIWDRFVPDEWKKGLVRCWDTLTGYICPRRHTTHSAITVRDHGVDPVGRIASKRDFDAAMAESDTKPVVIKFTADFCAPCKLIAPHFRKHADHAQTRMRFYEMDIEEMDSLAIELGVSSIPAFHVFQNRRKTSDLIGANISKLDTLIQNIG